MRTVRVEDEPRPGRAQLVAAGLLGLALLAVGLLIWRRPRSLPRSDTGETLAVADTALRGDGGGSQGRGDVAGAAEPPSAVQLSEARTLACQDRGPKRTLPSECDRLTSLEQVLSHAIQEAASCVPQTVSSATIEYVADVSFLRHTLRISLPKAARSVRDRKVVAACAAAVRGAIPLSSLDSLSHEHARYRIAITATYRNRG